MNKNLIIGGVIVALLLVGGFLYINSMKQVAPDDQIITTEDTQPTSTVPTDSMTTIPESTVSSVQETETVGNVKTFTIDAGNFYFKPSEMKVNKGDKVKITLTNSGGMHDLVIDELNVRSKGLADGESTTIEFTADKVGTFEYYCSVGKHRQMGMKGNLIVE